METDVKIGYEIPISRRPRSFASSWDLHPTSGVLYPTSGAWENARWRFCFPGTAHLPPQHMPFPGISVGFPPILATEIPPAPRI